MVNFICVLCVRPANKTYEFFSALQRKYQGVYEVVFVVDDDTYVEPTTNLKGYVTVVRINALECALAGYKGTHLWLGPERASSRDKALYYFTQVRPLSGDDQYVWFLEEDVFVPTVDTIWQIDKQDGATATAAKGTVDLLVSEHTIVTSESVTAGLWHWPHVLATIKNKIGLPLAKGMICAIRCSPALLKEVASYAALNKSLFLDEALFNTLALQAGLRVQVCEALRHTIKWCYNWTVASMDTEHLYHPVKCIRTQYYLRAKLRAHQQVEQRYLRMARVIGSVVKRYDGR